MNRAARRPATRSRGTIVVIVLLLAGSGMLRLAAGTGSAVAREIETIAEAHPTGSAESPAPVAPAGEAPQIGPLLAQLRQREADIGAREAALDQREEAVAAATVEVTQQLAALQEAELRLRDTIAQAETAAEQDIVRLTTVYENMKPKDGAALFAEMAPEFAAGFLARMRPDAAAGIMAGLPPQAAYSISVILAGRNAGVPTE